KDSVPVCGFAWIHWLAVNITKDELNENESVTATDFVQGTTSWSLSSVIKELGTAKFLIHLLSGSLPPFLLPSLIFGLGAIISF
ncbi:hypothetical protein ACTPD5_22595, partial [Clostridioides difficile]